MATIEDVWTAPDGSKRPRYGTGRRYRVRCDDLSRCGMSEFSAGPAFSPALPRNRRLGTAGPPLTVLASAHRPGRNRRGGGPGG